MITSAPPEFILTDTTGVVIATSGSTASILSTSGASTGDVLTVQGDGTLNFATPVVTESLTDLDEWAANTLTVPGALTVRQAGGVAGTDEVQIYHDGDDGYFTSESGNLVIQAAKIAVSNNGYVPDSGDGQFKISGTDYYGTFLEVETRDGNTGSTRLIAKGDAAGFKLNNNKYPYIFTQHDYNPRTSVELESQQAATMGGSWFSVQAKVYTDPGWTSGLKYTWEDGLEVAGVLYARQYGGVAGTDEIQIYHDGSNAHIDSQSGDLIFNNSTAKVNSSGEFTNNAGYSGCETFGIGATLNSPRTRATALGFYSQVGGESVAVGTYTSAGSAAVAIGAGVSTNASNRCFAADHSIAMGYQAQANYGFSIALQTYAKVTDFYQFVTRYIRDVYIGTGVTSSVPYDTTYHATGGSGTDISGANLILAGGKPTGAGTPGQVQFQVAPSGASGTTLGTLTTVGLFDEQGLTVRQAGGVAGTDEIQIYHDGSHGHMESQSGAMIVGTAANNVVQLTTSSSVKLQVESTKIVAYRDLIVDADVAAIAGVSNNAPGSWESPAGSDLRMQAGRGSSGNGGGILQIRSGNANGTDIAGSPMIVAGGPGTGAGDGGDFIVKHAVAGVSGSSVNNTWVDVVKVDSQGLTVLHPGGVAGTDEVQIYHDGTDGYIANQSGSLRISGDIITDDDSKIYLAEAWNTYIDNANQNIQFYSLGTLGLNVLGTTTRLPSTGKFCWSSSTANNTVEDTFLARNAAAEIYTPGKFIVRQPGGVAGTDEIQIYHDGTNGHIDSQSGDLWLDGGITSVRVYNGRGTNQPFEILHNDQLTAKFNYNGLQFYHGSRDYEVAKVNSGGNLTLRSDQGDLILQPDGTSQGDIYLKQDTHLEGILKVQQPGGVAGTDEIQIYHDGTDGYIVPQSGMLRTTGTFVIANTPQLYLLPNVLEEATINFRNYSAIKSKGGWGVHSDFSILFESPVNTTVMIVDRTSRVGIGIGATRPDYLFELGGEFALNELSADPSDPDEGKSVLWQSDGTGSGDDGDIMIKITAGGVTKTTTLIDFSAV